MKTLGQRIRELREARDLSLRELARKTGCSAAFMSDLELDRRHPSHEILMGIARVLETTVDDLQQYDTHLPVKEMRSRSSQDPILGLALRRFMDKKISADELIKWVEQRPEAKKKK